jgi:hypothetical protein
LPAGALREHIRHGIDERLELDTDSTLLREKRGISSVKTKIPRWTMPAGYFRQFQPAAIMPLFCGM